MLFGIIIIISVVFCISCFSKMIAKQETWQLRTDGNCYINFV